MTIFFNNISADDVSDETLGDGGPRIIFIRADNYGGGSIEIEIAPPSDPGKRFGDGLKDGEFFQDAEIHIDYLPAGTPIRVRLKGSSGASNVFVEIA